MLLNINSTTEDLKPNDYGVHVTVEELSRLRGLTNGLRLNAQQKSLASLAGSHHSSFRGRGIDFDETRIYQPGDDVRNIDWRVTARTGEAHTKIYQEERERPVYLVVDQGSSMYFGSTACFKSVAAARAAALLAWSAVSNKDRVGGLVFSDWEHQELRPKEGKRGIQALFRSLCTFNQAIGDNIRSQKSVRPRALTNALADLKRVARPGSLIIIISDFHEFDDITFQNLALLSRHNDIVGLSVFDQMEFNLPPAETYGFSDGKKRVKVNTSDKAMRNRFSARFTQHHKRLRQYMLETGSALIELATHADINETLRIGLNQRGNQRRR